MKQKKYWVLSLGFVVLWLFLAQLLKLFGVEMYQSGISINPQIILLVLPAVAAFFVASRAPQQPILSALALLVPIVTLGPISQLVGEACGVKTDFPGVNSLPYTAVFWLADGLTGIVPGILAGLWWTRKYGAARNKQSEEA